MNHLYIERGLERRKKGKFDWDIVAAMAIGAVLAVFVAAGWLFLVPHTHAAERHYTAIDKGGVLLTPKQFCDTI